MQHEIPVEQYGPHGHVMAQAVESCVHCGFCLPACPTYAVLAEEMDSPRGRIVLMKGVLEGQLELEGALPYIDRCLSCQGCVTACPSGVQYGELLLSFRGLVETQRRRPVQERAVRRLAMETLPAPGRFRLAATAAKLARPVAPALPERLSAMLRLLPERLPPAQTLPEIFPADGPRRARVALLAGCAQQALSPEINWATLRVLARNGVEVVVPRGQGCCGALALHAGDLERARHQAARNLACFPADVDAILTNAAGCGSGMQEYTLLFRESELEDAAGYFAGQVQDISVFLDELGILEPRGMAEGLRLAYHDACHLAHAQGVLAAPRRLLAQIPNLELAPIGEGELCCGSAGMYNIEQPEIARALGERKVRHILTSGAQGVVSGNIGCLVQIRTHLRQAGQDMPVWHTLEVLDRAYRAENL